MRLGDYEVLEAIGQGGMGIVYRGVQPIIKKRVAIKVMRPEVANDEAQVQRLIDEAEAVNAIGHRNIIDIFGMGRLPDGRPYIVMEFLEGQPLDQVLNLMGRPQLPDALALLIDIAGPLAAAHKAGVVHRDLKPSNVFLCAQPDGSRFVKLLDFGLAKRARVVQGDGQQTSETTVAGTPDYMAPEQARGLGTTPSTDLYALGVMAYEMVTGALPFHGETPMDVMMAHVQSPVPSARAKVPDLPAELDALISTLMAKSEAHRPPSADAVRDALIAIADAVSAEGYRPLEPRPRVSSPRPSGPRPGTPPQHPPPLPPPAGEPPGPLAAAPKRRVLPLAAGAGALVLVAALGFAALEARQPAPAEASAPAPPGATQGALPPPVAPPPGAAASPADPAPEPGNAGPAASAPPPEPEPAPVEATDELAPPAAADGKRRVAPPSPAAPTMQQLLARVATLQQSLQAAAARGEDVDPSAQSFLKKYRLQATMASTPADRAKVARALESWQRTFLTR